MTIYQILCMVGVPTLITGIIGYLIRAVQRLVKDQQELKKGVQALLRAQMIDEYNHYSAKGYAPIYAKENFENVYKAYHQLGANGVMQELYANFIELPNEKMTAQN